MNRPSWFLKTPLNPTLEGLSKEPSVLTFNQSTVGGSQETRMNLAARVCKGDKPKSKKAGGTPKMDEKGEK